MLEKRPSEATIVEVGPRDGLQNETTILSTEDKFQFIKLLADAGMKTIEATSFVRADKIPQMGDAEVLYAKISKIKGVQFPCLVPNMTGLENALKVNVNHIAVFTATSDTFNKKNTNVTVEESFERLLPVMQKAREKKMRVRGYISTAFGCPYEGKTSEKRLLEVVEFFLKNGADDISIGDTIGVATPLQVKSVVKQLVKQTSTDMISMHFHDTRSMAMVNSLTALEYGVTRFDSSAGGLGGCPYAKGATGNAATEDLVYLMHSLGVKTGVDIDKLSKASSFILSKLGRETQSKVLKAYLASHETTPCPF